MGIPYSREINNAFDQVTPLVAAGFKVLKTTKNVSILLAVIQVLTCVFLALILAVLIGLVYCVNPDLEKERHQLVTPVFKRLAQVTFLGIVEGIAAALVGFAGFVVMGFALTIERRPDDVEREGDQDANGALEGMTGKEKEQAKKGRQEADKLNEKEEKKK